jgi:hypothetical protein
MLVHKIHALMVVNVYRMVMVDSLAVVQIHLPDNVVKIVSSSIQLDLSTLFYIGIDPCASQPCRNGGTCQPLNSNSYQCICPPGYSGYDCSTRKLFCLDECENK